MNEEKEYLSEENYQKANIKVKKVGKILLIVGLIVLVLGFITMMIGFLGLGNMVSNGISQVESNSLNNSSMATGVFGSFGLFVIGGIMDTVGFGLAAAGGMIMFIAHRREITAYTAQQVMPVAKEGIEKMTPTVADSVGTIAKSISKGIKEGMSDSED